MKIKQKTITFGGAICASLIVACGAQAQNIFATANNNIYQITPDGTVTTFASAPAGNGLAFGPNGNLFMSVNGAGDIDEFT
ncbi:MAG: hypothetical protein ACREE6_05185, partial [Limisphaerales bacterium]